MSGQNPIIIADAGPLIRLAAAGLLDSMRLTNRRIVLVDRIEEEVCGDPTKPFAAEISTWIASMNGAIEHAETLEGIAISALRSRAKNPLDLQKLKRAMRNSGERAIREYVETLDPRDADEALVLYEDGAVPSLMAAATVPMTLMSTRAFVRMISERGYNRDAVQALEAIASIYNLKPIVSTVIEANSLPDD
ncbi:hypothetical protein [Rhizobium tumorigenes]|uniref:Uncharacterized protein n=1 Tax=Rhizobium tumorigenes TaxID=2041385 RepID=A0AAF1K2P7_9HYPH|nr:hypothetical protein [Rhizobium tumorigenes]WFR94144.1 hypothetical protein PR017_09810 [Rhizobium tumorigenes]